jgi:putative methyltransferase
MFSRLVPGAQKIVYSTCSIHAIENEAVVRDSLNSDEAATGRFSLAPSNQVLPQWHRRGLADVLESPG